MRAYQRTPLLVVSGLEQNIAWSYSAVLTGFSVKRRKHTWLAVVKADFPKGPMVAFVEVVQLHRLLEVVDEYANAGTLFWKHDKWPGYGKFRP